MIEKKTTVLFISIHKRVKSIVFAVFIKFYDESGLAILRVSFFSKGKIEWYIHVNIMEEV